MQQMHESTLTLHPFLRITPTLLTLVLSMVALMQITTDLYLPSLPAIALALNASPRSIQLTIVLYLIGFSASHLFYGPLSDRIGRRKPILFGIFLSACGSLICCCAPSTILLILGRFITGFGIGCCNSVGRSLARDLLTDRHLAKIGSQIGMISVFFMALSPTLGGYIQQYWGWRVNFCLILVFTSIVWVLAFFGLPETNQHPNPAATQFRAMKQHYVSLLKHPVFMGYTLCACFASAGLMAYITIAPFLFQSILGLSPSEFGWLGAILALAIFISGFANGRLIMRVGIAVMVCAGGILMLLGGVIMLLLATLHQLNIMVIMLPLALFSVGAGLIFINAFAGAFHPFPKMAGTTGALFGFLQDLSAGAGSMLMALGKIEDQVMLAVLLIALGGCTLIAWGFIPRQLTPQASLTH